MSTSIKKIEEAHNALVTKILKKGQRSAKSIVSANTRYNNLRNLLPKKFEWLMTEERLALESEMQGNCVVSYANKVKKDKCQIYSYVDSQGLRQTIEFNISRNKYHCVQLLSKLPFFVSSWLVFCKSYYILNSFLFITLFSEFKLPNFQKLLQWI